MIAALGDQAVAGILVAVVGGLSGLLVAWLNSRGQRDQARAGEAASVFEGYDELVANLRTERAELGAQLRDEAARHASDLDEQRTRFAGDVARHLEALEHAGRELAECERRCEECRAGLAQLMASLHALRAVVVDEAMRAAAAATITDVAKKVGIDPDDLDSAEAHAIRRFIEQLSPIPPTTEES